MMKVKLFNELIASVREGGKILRGTAKPSRSFVIEIPDVKKIRSNYKLSQNEFAALMGISVKTLRKWEQGRRSPEGAARVLLQVAENIQKSSGMWCKQKDNLWCYNQFNSTHGD